MLGININDVLNTLQNLRGYLIALGIVLLLAILATLAAQTMPRPTRKLIRANAWIAFLLAAVIVVNLIVWGPMYTLISLAMNGGAVHEETIRQASTLCTEIAEEGIVLLKNDGILPLRTDKVNTFGWSSTNPVYGGTGSGALSDAYPTVSLLEGLSNAGISYNTQLTDFYTAWRTARPTVGMFGQDWTIPEPSMTEYDAAGVFETAKTYSDTALIVIARSGGEGADLPTSYAGQDTFQEGGMFGASGVRYSEYPEDLDAGKHYLELTNREIDMVERVTREFDDVIVVVNASNAMELGWVNNYPSIKGVLLVPGPGQTGFNALGEILTGAINPSGKTTDTFVADLTATPTWNNFGNFAYTNCDDVAVQSNGATVTPTFINYTDGIYVGYRFWETADAEGLLDYISTVVYPFGYGLSYTSFTQEMGPIMRSDGTISFDVTVTNTGTTAGKDVVQVYYSAPYYNGGIEKAAVNLVAFDKTKLLAAGDSQTIHISFQEEDMASFDTFGKGCYVLEAGDYEISIRADAHTVIDSQTYTVSSEAVYDMGRSTDDLAATRQFDFAEGDVTYLSRTDRFANYDGATSMPVNYVMSPEVKAGFYNHATWRPEDFNDPADVMPTTGANNGLKLADLRGLSYDNTQWELLLDQLTVSDMNTLIALGGYQTAMVSSIGKVQTIDCDGPASINNNFTGQGSIGFPAAVMIAATWNVELAKDFGDSIGQMADEMGVSGWYAPAMNIHRSAFAGRNFEYYSEDGFLSGKMAAAAVQGAADHGVYSYMKHFALNDQETNRTEMLLTWCTEQAIREIYLKPFELAVKEGHAGAAMSAFNYIGNQYAGACPTLLKTVLREEWGFRGLVETDYFGGYGYQDADLCIRNGNDLCLAPQDNGSNHVTDQTSATSVLAMRQAAKNILYTTVNSRAYAEENLNQGMAVWEIATKVISVAAVILLAIWEVAAVKKFLAAKKS